VITVRIKTFPLWASVFTLLGVLVLCGLGTWQIQRLHWKETLLQHIDAAYAQDPAIITGSQIAALQEQDFIRAKITGSFRNDISIAIVPRIRDGKQGSHIVTPFVLDDGQTILVNRGWVPMDAQGTIKTIIGSTTITGLLRHPDQPNAFTPDNNPTQGQWFYIDPAMISSTFGLDRIVPLILVAEGPGDRDIFPIPVGDKPVLKNDHRAYATFWFLMAGVLLVIYALRFVVRKNPPA
jgi:surfeit locus 1 family protein